MTTSRFFWCARHDVIRGEKGYREHMEAEHNGRSDCVLFLSAAQVTRVLNEGITPFAASQPVHEPHEGG